MKTPIINSSVAQTIKSLDKQLALDTSLSRRDIADAKEALRCSFPYAISCTVGNMVVTRASWNRENQVFKFTLLKKVMP